MSLWTEEWSEEYTISDMRFLILELERQFICAVNWLLIIIIICKSSIFFLKKKRGKKRKKAHASLDFFFKCERFHFGKAKKMSLMIMFNHKTLYRRDINMIYT